MWDKLKTYLIETVLQKYLPMAGMSGIGMLGTYLAAHAGMLEKWGVNYISDWSVDWLTTHAISGPVILIELDTTSAALMTLVGVAAITLMRATEHHVAVAAQNTDIAGQASPQGETPK